MDTKERIFNGKIEFVKIDYEGIAKVLDSFTELYKVCENKKLIDNAFELLIKGTSILKTNVKNEEQH